MSFTTRTQFIQSQASDKTILAWLQAKRLLLSWTVYSGNTFVRDQAQCVVNVYEIANDIDYTLGADKDSLNNNEWFYDPSEGKLYVNTNDDLTPNFLGIIGTIRFFYSNQTLHAPFDLELGKHVEYEGRISKAPGFKHKIGIDQKLVSLIGNGDLNLINTDGDLDSIYDSYIFENQEVTIFSWNRDLLPSEAKIIYRGRVTNKEYTDDEISFTIKDEVFNLLNAIPQGVFTEVDGVQPSSVGRTKRWLYGRVDGLETESIDAIGEGYQITGTISATGEDAIVTGVGTQFLSELSPGDTLEVETQEMTIESIQSNTQLTLDSEPDYAFSTQTALVEPERPNQYKNREFFVADHACARLEKLVVNAFQLNRVELNNVTGLRIGDFLEFEDSERIEIKRISTGNVVVLQQNLILLPAPGETVIRQPVQNVYINGVRIFDEDYTINNSSTETTITLDPLTEFNLQRSKNIGIDLQWTNASRTVTTAEDVDLRELLRPRDWIRPNNIAYTTYYEILSVDETTIELRLAFGDATILEGITAKIVDYVGDDTKVSVDVLGRTEDNTPTGDWITTVAAATRDLVESANITAINTASFDQGEIDSKHLISFKIPESPGTSITKVKDAVDKLCKSVNASITLDNELQIKFKTLQVEAANPTILQDSDLSRWAIRAFNGDAARNIVIRYRHQDVDRASLEEVKLASTYESPFVKNYIGTNKTEEKEVYLYETRSADIMAHRQAYLQQLSTSIIELESDLRLENIEIGDTVQLDLNRLYVRFGDPTSNKKLCIVIGKTVDGERITLEVSDLANSFSTAAIITPNDAPDWNASDEDDRLLYGYITDSRGIIEDDENTYNINLIS